jgi:hypothetical protein
VVKLRHMSGISGAHKEKGMFQDARKLPHRYSTVGLLSVLKRVEYARKSTSIQVRHVLYAFMDVTTCVYTIKALGLIKQTWHRIPN